ncbi:hypothetical protein MRX96_043551 [Rhipicephalus microplus]
MSEVGSPDSAVDNSLNTGHTKRACLPSPAGRLVLCNLPSEIAAILISFDRHEEWLSREVKISRSSARYSGACFCVCGCGARESGVGERDRGGPSLESLARQCSVRVRCGASSLSTLALSRSVSNLPRRCVNDDYGLIAVRRLEAVAKQGE